MDDAAGAGQTTIDPAEPRSALGAILPHILRTFRREPALALTVAYLMVALAGIFYDYAFFQRGFGIPALTLSQLSDFLVAGLQRPITIALMLSTFPLCWVFDRINLRARHRRVKTIEGLRTKAKLSWLDSQRLRLHVWHQRTYWPVQVLYFMFVIVYGWWFVSVYAYYQADAVRRGDVPRVAVRLVGESSDLQATDPKGWGYLGAVSSYVFLYDPKAGRSLALPVNAIQRIQPEPVKGKASLPLPVVRLHLPSSGSSTAR